MKKIDLRQSVNWQRVDENADQQFYSEPRLVVHVDEHFIATLGKFLSTKLPLQATILDLMSSYKSHLPADYRAAKVVGLGMNATELSRNSQLTESVIQDLNQNPQLPFADASFDVVLNTVSVQYLQRPVEVFSEVGRVLKPGGLHIVSFSNRMFPTKAVQIWRQLNEAERVELVRQYFDESGQFGAVEVFREVNQPRWVSAYLGGNDPVYIVYAGRL